MKIGSVRREGGDHGTRVTSSCNMALAVTLISIPYIYTYLHHVVGRMKGNHGTVNPDKAALMTKSDAINAICVTSGTVNQSH